MIKFETDKELIQLQECWFRYGEVLQLTAQKFIQECYESQTLKQTEYETLRQGIEVPAKVQMLTEFIKFIDRANVQ